MQPTPTPEDTTLGNSAGLSRHAIDQPSQAYAESVRASDYSPGLENLRRVVNDYCVGRLAAYSFEKIPDHILLDRVAAVAERIMLTWASPSYELKSFADQLTPSNDEELAAHAKLVVACRAEGGARIIALDDLARIAEKYRPMMRKVQTARQMLILIADNTPIYGPLRPGETSPAISDMPAPPDITL